MVKKHKITFKEVREGFKKEREKQKAITPQEKTHKAIQFILCFIGFGLCSFMVFAVIVMILVMLL